MYYKISPSSTRLHGHCLAPDPAALAVAPPYDAATPLITSQKHPPHTHPHARACTVTVLPPIQRSFPSMRPASRNDARACGRMEGRGDRDGGGDLKGHKGRGEERGRWALSTMTINRRCNTRQYTQLGSLSEEKSPLPWVPFPILPPPLPGRACAASPWRSPMAISRSAAGCTAAGRGRGGVGRPREGARPAEVGGGGRAGIRDLHRSSSQEGGTL